MLRNGGATTRTTVPVSAGLLSDTDAYYDALTTYRNGDPNSIIEEFTRAAFAAVRNGQQLATDLRTLHDDWANNLRARRDAVAWRVLPFLLRQPTVTSKLVQDTFKVPSRQPTTRCANSRRPEPSPNRRPSTARVRGGTSSGRLLRCSKLSTGSVSVRAEPPEPPDPHLLHHPDLDHSQSVVLPTLADETLLTDLSAADEYVW